MTDSFDEITADPYRRLSADSRIDLQPGRIVDRIIIGENLDNEQTKPFKKSLAQTTQSAHLSILPLLDSMKDVSYL